ncbi:TonB-dependent receptor [Membranihabitans marinus]
MGLITLFFKIPIAEGHTIDRFSPLNQEITLIEAIQQISDSYNVLFNYDRTIISDIKVHFDPATTDNVDDAISAVLENTDLKYQMFNHRYVVIYKNDEEGIESLKEMIQHFQGIVDKNEAQIKRRPNLLHPLDSYNTGRLNGKRLVMNVSGTIVDQNGEPLIGVNVLVKGTNVGTATDFNGKFSMPDVDENATLIISYIGYQTQEIALNGRTDVRVVLFSDSELLDEVVVVGYGSQKSSQVTGAITTINSESLNNDLSVGRLDQALMGKISGVQVQQNSGAPGRSLDIKIRGTGSINFSNSPLYVVDGFPLDGGIEFLNPNDIESIDVLKDAASASIYGSRGSNGVVLITTKKGELGKVSIGFNMNYGLQKRFSKYDVLNRDEWIEFAIEERNNTWELNGGNKSDPNEVRSQGYWIDPLWLTNPESLPDNDWQDIVDRVAPIGNYQLSASAATDKFKYYVSGSYFDQKGIIVNSYFKRYSIQGNVEADFSEFLAVGLNFTGAITENNDPETDGYGQGISRSQLAPPVIGQDQNTQNTGYYPYAASWIVNPYVWMNETLDNTKNNNLLSNLYLTGKIIENLTWRSSIGIEKKNGYNEYFKKDNVNRGKGSIGSVGASSKLNLLTEHTLNYKINYDDWRADFLGGFTYQSDQYSYLSLDKTGFPDESIHTLNVASTLVAGSSQTSEWRLMSFLGRANFAFKDKYMLTSSIRRDGSSRFGKESRWGLFPSVSLGWRMAEESFMQNLDWVSDLKLRASYGETGNNNIGNYASIGTLQTERAVFGNPQNVVLGLRPENFSNTFLGWEKLRTTNIGVDVGFYNGKFQLTADVYKSVSSNLLLNVQIPQTTGFSSAIQNIGSLENKGVELDLRTVNFDGRFRWVSSFNISFNRNKVLELGPENAPLYGYGAGHLVTITEIGKPIGSYYLLKQAGVFLDRDDLEQNPTYNNQEVGDIKYLDYNKDGIIDSDDIHIVGNPHPDFIWGLSNSFSYKNFDLNVVIDGTQGANAMNIFKRAAGQSRNNEWGYWRNRWKSPEDPGDGMTPRAVVNDNLTTPSSFWLYDASYWSIRNITLGYTIPANIINNMRGISALKIYVSGSNIFMHDFYHHTPMAANYSNSPLTPNLDNASSYPLATTYTFGVNLKL